MGYQFAHFETFSRKGTNKKLSVKQCLDEAKREPGACPHVPDPHPPELIYGISLDELEQRHDSLWGPVRGWSKTYGKRYRMRDVDFETGYVTGIQLFSGYLAAVT